MGCLDETSGYAMSLRQVPVRAAVETSNAFAALAAEEPDVPDPPEPPGSVPQRAGRSVALLGALRRCCGLTSSQCRFESANASMPLRPLDHADNVPVAGETTHAETPQTLRPCRPKVSAKAFLERRTQSLKPLASGWEKLQMILDSGASVSVVPPSVGRDYEVVRGEAAMAGVRYEIADGNEIQNLGEKLLPVVTREDSWRGLKVEVADIARAFQSVRSLVKTGHKVVFGNGLDGTAHYIEHNATGEVNWVEDDGLNYLMTYLIAPKESAGFTRPAPSR